MFIKENKVIFYTKIHLDLKDNEWAQLVAIADYQLLDVKYTDGKFIVMMNNTIGEQTSSSGDDRTENNDIELPLNSFKNCTLKA